MRRLGRKMIFATGIRSAPGGALTQGHRVMPIMRFLKILPGPLLSRYRRAFSADINDKSLCAGAPEMEGLPDLNQIFKNGFGESRRGSKRNCKLQHEFDYDVLVIGGGSGGLACAREAASLGGKVAVVDFVKPSPKGTTWGLGGTCVNVGCIPKKLMHHAGTLGQYLKDAKAYGWELNQPQSHSWNVLVENVQDYIKGINFSYKVALQDEAVEYFNASAEFKDSHSVRLTTSPSTAVGSMSSPEVISAAHIVIATGGRPTIPSTPGAREFGITSDDIFSLARPPGKTLVVGGSYIALETAGFLRELGFEVTVMVRSILLRGFDQQMAEKIGEDLSKRGVKFIRPCVLLHVSPEDSGGLSVHYGDPLNEERLGDESFETVIFAIGRTPQTAGLGLSNIGIKLNSDSGKVETTGDRTSIPHIYAIGDVVEGRPELTPAAIHSGRQLARRILSAENSQPDFEMIPTAVFTPQEYATVGLSEEAAIKKFGEDQVEVYHLAYDTLEVAASHRVGPDGLPANASSYCKAVVVNKWASVEEDGPRDAAADLLKNQNKLDKQRVVGLHLLGPNAAEIMQGFAVAMKLGLTKADLDETLGIHPTQAEELVGLDKTKRSGVPFTKTSC